MSVPNWKEVINDKPLFSKSMMLVKGEMGVNPKSAQAMKGTLVQKLLFVYGHSYLIFKALNCYEDNNLC